MWTARRSTPRGVKVPESRFGTDRQDCPLPYSGGKSLPPAGLRGGGPDEISASGGQKLLFAARPERRLVRVHELRAHVLEGERTRADAPGVGHTLEFARRARRAHDRLGPGFRRQR